MVIIRITGGLGNQMFQYAFARSYAAKHRLPLKLDITSFDKLSTHNGFELTRLFKTKAAIASLPEIAQLTGHRDHRIAKRLNRYLGLKRHTFYLERNFNYQDLPAPSKEAIYFNGYFQSYKYFDDFKYELMNEFTFTPPLNDRTSSILDRISANPSVSVHVRRGDYIQNPENLKTLGALGIEYYREAIEVARRKAGGQLFCVFSDDIQWCQDNLPLKSTETIFVSHNKGTDSWQDMVLMSHCQVNILANSSFSWWASWLNKNSDVMRIAPSPWFRSEQFNDDDVHLPETILLKPRFI